MQTILLQRKQVVEQNIASGVVLWIQYFEYHFVILLMQLSTRL